jgi:hypothetical protein
LEDKYVVPGGDQDWCICMRITRLAQKVCLASRRHAMMVWHSALLLCRRLKSTEHPGAFGIEARGRGGGGQGMPSSMGLGVHVWAGEEGATLIWCTLYVTMCTCGQCNRSWLGYTASVIRWRSQCLGDQCKSLFLWSSGD